MQSACQLNPHKTVPVSHHQTQEACPINHFVHFCNTVLITVVVNDYCCLGLNPVPSTTGLGHGSYVGGLISIIFLLPVVVLYLAFKYVTTSYACNYICVIQW